MRPRRIWRTVLEILQFKIRHSKCIAHCTTLPLVALTRRDAERQSVFCFVLYFVVDWHVFKHGRPCQSTKPKPVLVLALASTESGGYSGRPMELHHAYLINSGGQVSRIPVQQRRRRVAFCFLQFIGKLPDTTRRVTPIGSMFRFFLPFLFYIAQSAADSTRGRK